MDKVRVIERSLRCFVMGCLGMIPLLGIIPAVVAIGLYHNVRQEAELFWNPARGYLLCGYALAWAGIGLTFLTLGVRFSKYLF
jgi:hypothetical protein